MFADNSRASSAKLRSSHICKVRSKSSGHLSWLLIKSFGCGVGTAILLFALAAQIFAHTALSLELVKPATCASVAVGAVLSGLVLANGIAQKRLLCGVSVGVFYALCLSLTTALSGKPLVFDHVNLALLAALLFGGTAGGVTAASAIAALQEAGSKLSRDMLKSAYRAFARECYLIIDLMRQFYDEERVFRVIGPAGGREFVPFSGAALRARPMGLMGGVELGSREPVFDIVVSAEKKSTFSRLSQNETAKECYQLGFFAPQNADAALAALEMMDFEGIEKVRQRVRQNGTLAQKLTAAQMQIARFNEKLSGAEENLSTRALAKNLSGALRQLSRRESQEIKKKEFP